MRDLGRSGSLGVVLAAARHVAGPPARRAGSAGGLGGLDDDAGDHARVGDHREVGAWISVMRACALLGHEQLLGRRDDWSAVPTTSQDGIVFQAGTPDWS